MKACKLSLRINLLKAANVSETMQSFLNDFLNRQLLRAILCHSTVTKGFSNNRDIFEFDFKFLNSFLLLLLLSLDCTAAAAEWVGKALCSFASVSCG